MDMAFSNFQELPVAAEAKQVVVRQIAAGFYPASSYTIAVNLVYAPLAMIETIIMVRTSATMRRAGCKVGVAGHLISSRSCLSRRLQGSILYFIPGFVLEADRFFFYLFLLFSNASAMSQLVRAITYLGRNADGQTGAQSLE
jgi:hypothetical protein